MPRPYTYAGEYPTAHKYSTVYGISQGQKYIIFTHNGRNKGKYITVEYKFAEQPSNIKAF